MSDTRSAPGRVITFYSYKGGTGRSMALANIAWMLACAGRRVLAIDWDLEAPGLHRYFRPFLIDDELTATDGLIDFVDRYATEAVRPIADRPHTDTEWYLPFADFSDYIVSVNFPHFRSGGRIDFLPAGRQGDHYALAVSSFNWQNFYDRLGGGGFIEAFKRRATQQYDYILIDSRTGVSDTAGICSVQMPDTLVVCFTYNNQSIKGASAVARSALGMRGKLIEEKRALHRAGKATSPFEETLRPYRVFPVAMRVDSGESDRLAIRQAFARRAFDHLVEHIGSDHISEYWKSVEVPHTVFYSYEEVLAPFKDDPKDPKTVLAALLRLMRYVTDRDVVEFQLPISPAERQGFLDSFAETPLTAAGKKALSDSHQETDEEVLARTAEAALAEMSERDRAITRRVLSRLVRVDRDEDGGGYFPNKVSLLMFDDEQRQIVEQLTTSRVVTVSIDPSPASARGGEAGPLVSLSDPRLLTSWRTLIEWLNEDRDFLAWRQRLRAYANDWESSGRDRGALLSGRLLNEADLRAMGRTDDLTAGEREYIAESRETSGRLKAMWKTAAMVTIVLGAAFGLLRWLQTGTDSPAGAVPAAEIELPTLTGISSGYAQTTGEALGLVIRMTDGRSEPLPFIDGIVTAQTPAVGSRLARGAPVTLTVSAFTVAAPTLVGMNLSGVLQALDQQRLKPGRIDSKYVSDAKVATVLTQSPSPGTVVAAGTAIDIVVSRPAQLSDFRIGVYFLDGDKDSKALAEALRGLVRKTGHDAALQPRPETFFVGSYQAKRHEIRFGSDAEKVAAGELQLLLEKDGGFPRFALVPTRRASEGFISVFLLASTPPDDANRGVKAR